MSDKATAWLRTVVPAAWGSLIVWLVAQVPDIPESVVTWLTSEATVTVVVALAIGLWYWLWRKVEGYVPDWLIRLALGSALSPSYGDPVMIASAELDVDTATGGPTARVTLTDGTEQHFA